MPQSIVVRPVTLPPSRARLAASPVQIGSDDTIVTIGIVEVACLAVIASRSSHDDDVGLQLHEISDEIADQLISAGSKTSFEDDVVPFDASGPASCSRNGQKTDGVAGIGPDGNEADTRDRGGLLRASSRW